MPNVTVTPPATIKVQVGPASAPTASAIQYGGQAVSYTHLTLPTIYSV